MLAAVTVLLCAFGAVPQAGSFEAELKRMAAEDQADRQFTGHPTKQQEAVMTRGDARRLSRMRQILREAKAFNAQEFDAASLLFQHARTPDDFATAHELSVCANVLGKMTSMPAISEDRYLMTIRRKQRFGGQFKVDGKTLVRVDTEPPTAVTDDLRLNMMCPPLEGYRKYGPMAFREYFQPILDRIELRRNPNKPLLGNPDLDAELRESTPSAEARGRVLRHYMNREIQTAAEYSAAARLLLSSSKPAELLLAHEFATLAAVEKDQPARQLFCDTWDAFARSIHQPIRYGKNREPAVVRQVLRG